MTHRALRILLVTVLVLLALPGTAAADCTDGAGALTAEELDAVTDAYNQNAGDLPGFVAGQVAGERVELHITGSSDVVYTVAFDDAARATSVTEGSANPSLRITVASATLCDALDSPNPAAELASAYKSGDVDIEGVGTANSIKVGLVKTAIGVGEFFGFF